MKRVRRPSSYAGLVVAVAAAGVVGAFAACNDFTPPGAISNSSTLAVSPKTVHLHVGSTLQLRVTGASGPVTWSSSADTIATVSLGKVTGVASGTTTIRAVSGTSRATATITVSIPAAIAVSSTSVDFNAFATAGLPDSQTVAITNVGEDSLTGLTVDSISYGAGATNWLTASLTGTDAPAQLVLRPKTTALAPGSYTATVSVSSPVVTTGPQFVAVRFTLGRPAAIALGTSTVSFTAQQGSAVPAQQSVAVTDTGDAPLTGLGVGTITFTPTSVNGWLTASVNPNSAPASLLVRPNTTALAPGDYSATVPVTSTIAGVTPASLTVNYHVTAAPPPPVMGVNPTSLAFTAGRNFGALPSAQSVSVTSSGVGTISGLSASVSYTGLTTGWLSQPSFSGNNTTAPTTLVVQPNSTALPAGVYNATIHLTSTTTGVAPQDIPITYVVNDFVFDQTSVQFSTTTATAPPDKIVSVSNGGGGTISNVTATVTLLPGGRADATWNWLSASIASTVPQSPSATSLRLQVLRADSLGDFAAQVTVSAPGMVSKTVTVNYRRQATMATDIWPILHSTCLGCHSSATSTNFFITFADTTSAYNSLVNPTNGHTYVQVSVPGVSGDSSTSNLFQVLNGLEPASGGPYFNMPPACLNNVSCMNAQLRTRIYIWIQQGALKQ